MKYSIIGEKMYTKLKRSRKRATKYGKRNKKREDFFKHNKNIT